MPYMKNMTITFQMNPSCEIMDLITVFVDK